MEVRFRRVEPKIPTSTVETSRFEIEIVLTVSDTQAEETLEVGEPRWKKEIKVLGLTSRF